MLGRRAVKKAQYPSRIPAAITLADFSDDDDDEREMDRTEEGTPPKKKALAEERQSWFWNDGKVSRTRILEDEVERL